MVFSFRQSYQIVSYESHRIQTLIVDSLAVTFLSPNKSQPMLQCSLCTSPHNQLLALFTYRTTVPVQNSMLLRTVSERSQESLIFLQPCWNVFDLAWNWLNCCSNILWSYVWNQQPKHEWTLSFSKNRLADSCNSNRKHPSTDLFSNYSFIECEGQKMPIYFPLD